MTTRVGNIAIFRCERYTVRWNLQQLYINEQGKLCLNLSWQLKND